MNTGVALLMWASYCYMCIACHGIAVSTKDPNLRNQLKMINKPAVKIIKTIYGDTYGCVNFFQQPAFDHPALRNHNYHPKMRFTSYKKRDQLKSSNFDQPRKLWLGGQGCPQGTIPIKRRTEDDLVRDKQPLPTLVHTAVLETSKGSGKYNGGGMGFTFWNPIVGPNQYSSSRIEFRIGADIIQYGWTVNLDLNKDNRTRTFVYTKTATTGPCFNLQCPGYIHMSPDYPIDMALSLVSRYGVNATGLTIEIHRDEDKQGWVLEDVLKPSIVFGFWPQEIFSKTKDPKAAYVSWGGEVASPATQALPQMGIGLKNLELCVTRAALCCNISVINEKFNVVEPSHVDTFTDLPEIYMVKDVGHKLGSFYGRSIFFGGAGGLC